jgi:N-acetylmuramoyl-L-alanine amidase
MRPSPTPDGVSREPVVEHGTRMDVPPPQIHAEDWDPMPLEEAMRLIDQRSQWQDIPPIQIPRHPAERFLQGMTIVIDPGHGGTDGGDLDPRERYKAGPTGVKEAHMNLRVGLLLRRLLEDAGANVIITREGDDTLELRERAEIANNAPRPDGGVGADLFLSLHHNAHSTPETNSTSVWYHGEVDWAEPDLDIARYIVHALNRTMRTDAARSSPLYSDQLMYRTGFGVLRQTRMPALLLESSFFTNPDEEQRLRDAGYNLMEAYAIYEGLCEYAYGGRPTQEPPRVSIEGSRVFLETTLDDGLPRRWWGSDRNRIIASSIALALDGEPMDFQFDPGSRRLQAMLPIDPEAPGEEPREYVLSIHHANKFKHHNWPQRYELRLVMENAEPRVDVEPLPPVRARRMREPDSDPAPAE